MPQNRRLNTEFGHRISLIEHYLQNLLKAGVKLRASLPLSFTNILVHIHVPKDAKLCIVKQSQCFNQGLLLNFGEAGIGKLL